MIYGRNPHDKGVIKADHRGDIKRERLSRGMTIEEVAEMLSLTSGFVGLIERGSRGITLLNLCKLSELFAVDIGHFVYDHADMGNIHDENEEATIRRKKITTLISMLNTEQLDFLVKTIKNMGALTKTSANGNTNETVVAGMCDDVR